MRIYSSSKFAAQTNHFYTTVFIECAGEISGHFHAKYFNTAWSQNWVLLDKLFVADDYCRSSITGWTMQREEFEKIMWDVKDYDLLILDYFGLTKKHAKIIMQKHVKRSQTNAMQKSRFKHLPKKHVPTHLIRKCYVYFYNKLTNTVV